VAPRNSQPVLVLCTMALDPQGIVMVPFGSSLFFDNQVSPTIQSSPQLLYGYGVSAASYIPALEHYGSSWRRTKRWGSLSPTPPTSWGDLTSLLDPPSSPRQLSLFLSPGLFHQRQPPSEGGDWRQSKQSWGRGALDLMTGVGWECKRWQ
jgi:hypothetical protein